MYIDFRKISRVEVVNEKVAEFLYSKMGIIGAVKQLKENAVSFLIKNKTNISIKTPIDVEKLQKELLKAFKI